MPFYRLRVLREIPLQALDAVVLSKDLEGHGDLVSRFIIVETEHVLCSTVAQENSAFARCCVLGFAAA